MQENQKGCKNIHAEEEQITAARMKQHEDKEEDAGIRPKTTKKRRTKKDKEKPTGVLKNVMQEDQKGCKNNNIREQITAARTKQHGDEEEDTSIRPAGRENMGTKKKTSQKEQTKQARHVIHKKRVKL